MNIQTFDEWPGINDTPKSPPPLPPPAIRSWLLLPLRELLGQLTGDPSLTVTPNRAAEGSGTAPAMFSAVKELGIQLTVTPGNYGETGQKIRLADEIYDTRLASSLT